MLERGSNPCETMENDYMAHLFGTSEQFLNLRTGFKFDIDVKTRLDAIHDFSVDVNLVCAAHAISRWM